MSDSHFPPPDRNILLDTPEQRLTYTRLLLEEVICTEGCDSGVVLLSQDAPTHLEGTAPERHVVYDLQYFSPLGEALIAIHKLTDPHSYL